MAASSPGTGAAAQRPVHPVTVTVDPGHPGPVIPGDFAGLSFERGPVGPGNAGLSGNLFRTDNTTMLTLFRNMGLGSLRVGGGTVDTLIPAGTGSDGFAGIDAMFAFAAAAQIKVIFGLRLLNPSANPVTDLQAVNARVAGYIWQHYRPNVASFAIGNEPDWHTYHTPDPAIYEANPGTPGSAYPSYLAHWQTFADAVRAAAPGAALSGPDLGAYDRGTYTPDKDTGASWTARLAADEKSSGRVTEVTQHYYVGGSPYATTAEQAISNMLSPEWVTGTAIGAQPANTSYTPYPWLYENNLAPVTAAGLRFRLTESNDYLGGVQDASNAYAAALWALDHLHWFALHGCAGVHFHNKQWVLTDTIVPDKAGGYMITPKGYGIKAFTLGAAGQAMPVQIQNPAGVNVTAYCVSGAAEHYVTVINKAHGAGAPDAAVTIAVPGAGGQGTQAITLAGTQPGDAQGQTVTLGGAMITGAAPWGGTWSALPAGPHGEISLTVKATTAAIVKIPSGG